MPKELVDHILFPLADFKDKEEIRQIAREHNLKIALFFYSYLNDLSDEYLEKHNFSREEIADGLKNITNKYGVNGFADAFLDD